ncbi:MAG: type II secretion system protein GspG [Sandaracinaceae bacterium]
MSQHTERSARPARSGRRFAPLPRLKRLRRRAGLTLVEIMIVVIIVALMATGAAVVLLPQIQRSREQQTKIDIQAIRGAAVLYYMQEGRCPVTVEEMTEGEDPYLDPRKRTTDAWDNEFDISCEGSDVIVTSPGENGEFGDDDDIAE